MKNVFFGLIVPIVFFLGFLCGSAWEKFSHSTAALTPSPPVREAVSIDAPVKPVVETETVEKIAETEADLDRQEKVLEEALKDEEFRKVHDFLVHENPVRLNVDLNPPEILQDKTDSPPTTSGPDE